MTPFTIRTAACRLIKWGVDIAESAPKVNCDTPLHFSSLIGHECGRGQQSQLPVYFVFVI